MVENISLVVILISICYICVCVCDLDHDLDPNLGDDISENLKGIEPESRCMHHIEIGFCIKHIQRWGYFNGDCYEFFYSGCGGNANNFPSLESCLSHCEKLINNNKEGKIPLNANKKRSLLSKGKEKELGENDVSDDDDALLLLNSNEELSSESKMQGFNFADKFDPFFIIVSRGLIDQTDNELKKVRANSLRMRVMYFSPKYPKKKRIKMRPHNILFPKAMTISSTASSNTVEDDYYTKINSIFSRQSEEIPAFTFIDEGKINYRTVYKGRTRHQKLDGGSKFVNYRHRKTLNSIIEIYHNRSRLNKKHHKERMIYKLKKLKKRDRPIHFPETIMEPIDHAIFVRTPSIQYNLRNSQDPNLVSLPRLKKTQRVKIAGQSTRDMRNSKRDFNNYQELKRIPHHETQMESLLQFASPNHEDSRLKKDMDILPYHAQNYVVKIIPKRLSRVQRSADLSDPNNRMSVKRGPWINVLYDIKDSNTTERIPHNYPYRLTFFFKPKTKKTVKI